jgi:hypothetical protein
VSVDRDSQPVQASAAPLRGGSFTALLRSWFSLTPDEQTAAAVLLGILAFALLILS